MMTSSSSPSRVIKRADASDQNRIQQYAPPRETVLRQERRPSFPKYGKDGKPKGEAEFLRENNQPQEDLELDLEQIREMKEEAQKLLEEAKIEAGQILEKAREEAAQEFETARIDGYQSGYEDGRQDGRRDATAHCEEQFKQIMAGFTADMKQALRSVEMAKEKCVKNYLDELKDCAIAVGEKVIHISLRSSGEVIKQMIISATEKLKKTAWVKIYIEKCDYDLMMEADTDILDELSRLSDNIKFIVMDKEERGNCIIEMPEEIVDISVNTQIENIKDILENVRV